MSFMLRKRAKMMSDFRKGGGGKNDPQTIGHHLCMFPYRVSRKQRCIHLRKWQLVISPLLVLRTFFEIWRFKTAIYRSKFCTGIHLIMFNVICCKHLLQNSLVAQILKSLQNFCIFLPTVELGLHLIFV